MQNNTSRDKCRFSICAQNAGTIVPDLEGHSTRTCAPLEAFWAMYRAAGFWACHRGSIDPAGFTLDAGLRVKRGQLEQLCC